MIIRKLQALAVATLCAVATSGYAADFPERPIRVIMPFPAGTGPDNVMRQVGERLAAEWKQQVIVENRAGGNGWIAMEAVKRAAPDGYTLVLVDSPLMSLHPHLYKKLPFSPTADFVPVASFYRTYYLVTVGTDSKWKSVQDLIAAAKANPDGVTYGSSGTGGNLHLGGAMMANAIGAKMRHIPYKETGQVYIDVSRGEIDWAFGTASTTAPLYKSKKVRYLAISAPERSPTLPDVPTLREAVGPAAVDLQTWVALFAPRGTPQVIVDRINATVKTVLEQPEMRAQLANVGFEPFIQTPSELGRTVDTDSNVYADIVTRSKISVD